MAPPAAFVGAPAAAAAAAAAAAQLSSAASTVSPLGTVPLTTAPSRAAAVARRPLTHTLRQPSSGAAFAQPPPAGGRPSRVLMWFHSDLRLADNAALTAAAERASVPGGVFVPFVSTSKACSPDYLSAIVRLRDELSAAGTSLVVRATATTSVGETLLGLVRQYNIQQVVFNHSEMAEPTRIEGRVIQQLADAGVDVEAFWSNTLHAPLKEKKTLPTFVDAVSKLTAPPPTASPSRLPQSPQGAAGDATNTALPANVNGQAAAAVLRKAQASLSSMRPGRILAVKAALELGVASPRMVAEQLRSTVAKGGKPARAAGALMSELVWRSYVASSVVRAEVRTSVGV